MVAVAMMEHGADALSAVEEIRSKRRGALNQKQIAFLEKYKPGKRRKKSSGGAGGSSSGGGCSIC